MRVFKGIEFGEGINVSFPEFKEVYGSNHVFNNIHPDQREQELKKAYKIATDGNSSRSTKESKEDTAK